MRQHCTQLESTVQRLLQQLEEVAETRDKEALELATLRRELRLRDLRGPGDSGPGSASGSASGSAPGSGHSDSPQLPGKVRSFIFLQIKTAQIICKYAKLVIQPRLGSF